MKKKKSIRFIITIAIILSVLAGTAAVTKGWIGNRKSEVKIDDFETVSVMDESDIGSPTNDDPWQEMEKMVQAYYGNDQEQIAYEGKMKLIDDNGQEQKVVEELSFQYTFFKGQYYYSIGQVECIAKEKFIILVDHSSKSIAISLTETVKEKKEGLMSMADFKKILEHRSSGAKVTESGNAKILTINNIQDPSIQGYQVYYDPISYQIKKMLIGMIRLSPLENRDDGVAPTRSTQEKPTGLGTKNNEEQTDVEGYAYYLEITYTRRELTPMSEQKFHPEERFIRFNKGKPEILAAFRGYRMIN